MKNWKILWLSFLCLFLWSGHCFADYINPGRPFSAFGTSWDGTNRSLQDELNNITVGLGTSSVGVDVVNDQIAAALFTNTASGNTVATIAIEVAGFADTNIFGIYSAANPGNTAQIFAGPVSPGDLGTSSALVSFLSNGDVYVNGAPAASGFGNVFGFYITTQENNTFYSEDSLNTQNDPNGDPQALIIQGDNDTTLQIPGYSPGLFTDNEFIIAFEDL